MKKMLVPIDFSPASRNASEYAAALARMLGAEIYLLHVFAEPAPAAEMPGLWMITATEMQEECAALVQKEVAFLKQKYAVTVHGGARLGYTTETIKEVAESLQSDLVVAGMKLERTSRLFGSTVVHLIRHAKAPVLVIPESTSFQPVRHMVLAVDFNEIKNAACFAPLFRLLELFDAGLQVLHVQQNEAAVRADEVPGKLQLERLLSGVSFRYQEVEDDDVERGIQEYCNNHPAEMLVMVAHPHNILERVFGSIHTRNMSYETRLPLLVLEDKP